MSVPNANGPSPGAVKLREFLVTALKGTYLLSSVSTNEERLVHFSTLSLETRLVPRVPEPGHGSASARGAYFKY